MEGFDREALTKALVERTAVQATLMRSTIHVVSARDIPCWQRESGDHAGTGGFECGGTTEPLDMDEVARRLQGHLADGPRRQEELIKLLAAEGLPREAWTGGRLWLDMVRVPPSGTWDQRRADLYWLASRWLPASEPTQVEALEHLLRRYLGGFGPGSLADAANWAGVLPTAVRPAAEALPLRRFEDEKGRELLDLPGAPLPDPETPAPVRFLPTWDAC